MKTYRTPSTCNVDRFVASSSSLKQVAHAFSTGFARGVRGADYTEHPVMLNPIRIANKHAAAVSK